jgi:N-acylneuraminate cytidylyltransferase
VTKPIAIIPARAGSKRLPGKNRRLLGGYPLWQWSAEWARKAGCTVVVTTDDEALLESVRHSGHLAQRRPGHLCTDHASLDDVVRYVLITLIPEPGNPVVLLQPTSPFRSHKVIHRALAMLTLDGYDSVVGVVPEPKAHFRWTPDGPTYGIASRPRTQDLSYRIETGAIYAFRAGPFLAAGNSLHGRIGQVLMPPWAGLDVDTAHDWSLIEALAEKHPGLSPFEAPPDFVATTDVERGELVTTGQVKAEPPVLLSAVMGEQAPAGQDYEWLSREYADMRRRLDRVTRERDALRRRLDEVTEQRDQLRLREPTPDEERQLDEAMGDWHG